MVDFIALSCYMTLTITLNPDTEHVEKQKLTLHFYGVMWSKYNQFTFYSMLIYQKEDLDISSGPFVTQLQSDFKHENK